MNVSAIDELAQLVGGFNRMTADLEASRGEIEARAAFHGSNSREHSHGHYFGRLRQAPMQRVNKALDAMLPHADPEPRRGSTNCSRAKTRRKFVT